MRDLKSGLFFFGLSLLVLGESLRVGLGNFMQPGSGMLSFGGGLALFGLSIALIYRGWGVREREEPSSRRVILALLSLFAYSLLLDILGFLAATFFLVGILVHLGQPRRWWVLIGVSALVSFLAYFIFGVFLHVYFPRGFLGI
ncbi:MAG: tripartite tricarboxylate transporter TctB family protein [Pseudomonadota bacterium]